MLQIDNKLFFYPSFLSGFIFAYQHRENIPYLFVFQEIYFISVLICWKMYPGTFEIIL